MAETKEAITQRIKDLLLSLIAEGIINDRFCFVRELDVYSHNPASFVHLVTGFLADTQKTLADMANALSQPVLAYHELFGLCIKIRGATLSLGAHAMATAVNDLFQAITGRLSRQRCTEALDLIRRERINFNNKLQGVMELQRRLIDGPSR